MRTFLRSALLALTICFSGVSPPHADAQQRFGSPGAEPGAVVEFISPARLAARLVRPNVVVVDVRSAREYATSHIAGAVHVDVEAPLAPFLKRFIKQGAPRWIVIYCTIGARSRYFADRLVFEIEDGSRVRLLVLDGGIVAWHNAALPLVDARGPTRRVHVYSAEYLPHLKYSEHATYDADPAAQTGGRAASSGE